MSKMDAMRAMREARYAETTPRAAKPATVPKAKAPKATVTGSEPVATHAEPSGADLCGHRNISSRTCTRAQGHPEKSHRYS